jgi:hypothetical protein
MGRSTRSHLPAALLLALLFSVDLHAGDFYPLRPGTSWTYRVWQAGSPPPDTSIVVIRVIGDTILPNGRTYAQLSRPDFLGARLIRVDSDYVYCYSLWDSVEVAVFDLRAEHGTTHSINWGGLFTSTVSGIDTIPVFGRPTMRRSYKFDGLVMQNVELGDRFGIINADDWADGCGPYSPCTNWTLRGCIIGDSLYGTTVAVERVQNPPNEPLLLQNYPNPFNPKTTIEYELPRGSAVRLSVWNVLGQEVAVLVDGVVSAGAHSVAFDGSRLPSGVYFYEVETPELRGHRRMVLLK